MGSACLSQLPKLPFCPSSPPYFPKPLLRVRNRCIGRSGASTSTLACNPPVDCLWTFGSLFVGAVFDVPDRFVYACTSRATLPSAEAPTRVHKSNIGCSGVTTWFGASLAVAGRLDWFFAHLAAFVVPLARGWLCCVSLAICSVFLWPSRKRGPTRQWRLRYMPGSTAALLVPLGNAVTGVPVVVWRPGKSKPKHMLPSRGRCSWLWPGRLLYYCGLLHLPQPCLFQPWGAIVPIWICNFPTAAAMARTEGPDDLPPTSRRPHLVRPETLTSQVGVSFPEVPWTVPVPVRLPAFATVPRQGPWESEGPPAVPDHDWLGVYVYTPHYTTVAVAISVPRQASMQEVFDVLLQRAPGVPPGVMNCLEPLRPQRFDSYLHVIRYPGCIRGVHDGYAAVVADLTRVGGYYFATVLPKQLSYAELVEYLTPLASEDEAPFRIFVGARSHPWPLAALVTLGDGDVITVVRDASFVPSRIPSTQLSDRSNWGPMRHFFDVERHPCIGVLYGSQRFCIASHYHYGETIIDHLTRCLRLEATRITTCTFHTPDLDIQGSHCPDLVTVHDVRPIIDTSASRARQDVFILCDMRPLGLKPVFVHAHVPTVHVPSLLSDFGVDLPPAFQVGIHGGCYIGDYVSVEGSCVLLFYVQEAQQDGSSDNPSPAMSASPAAPDGPAADAQPLDDFGSPAHTVQGTVPPWLDPSVPPGHSWNEAEDFSVAVWRDFPAATDRRYTGTFPSVEAPRNFLRQSQSAAPDTRTDQSMDDTGGTSLSVQPRPLESNLVVQPPPGPLASFPPEEASVAHSPLRAQDGGHHLQEFNTYIYVPDFLPEMITASAFMPCSVDAAMSAVAGARRQEAVLRFPRLILASPQPDRWYLIALAVPNWLNDRPVVLLDCRRINQTMFAKLLHSSLNRESLLRAAGVSCRSPWDVYVHGLLRPLEHGQRITLVSGMVVTFVPHGCGAPATYEAATLLAQGDSWDLDAVVTAPGGAPGQHFWLLTDGMPAIFEVKPGRRPTFKADIASHLQARDHALALIGAQPRIRDSFFDGIWTSGVIVATEQLSRIPCPPARRRDSRLVVILDARAVLSGISWIIVDGPYLPTSRVTDLYEALCPREHSIVVFGADIVVRHATRCFAVTDGSVLTIDFFEDLLGADSPDSGPPPDDDLDDAGADDPGGHGSGPPDSKPPSARLRNRSRTPARHPPSDRTDSAAGLRNTEPLSAVEGASPSQSVKWSCGTHGEAFLEGSHSLTPAVLGYAEVNTAPLPHPGIVYVPAPGTRQHFASVLPFAKELLAPASFWAAQSWVPPFGFSSLPCALGPKVTWDSVNLHDALPESKHFATPALWTHARASSRFFLAAAARMITLGLSDFLFDCAIRPDPVLLHAICRLLQAPPSTTDVAGATWEAARTATQRLGLPWPFAQHGIPLLEPLNDTEGALHDDEEATLTQAIFVLLTPGYTAEVLNLQILVPQSIEDILDLVDTCRAQDMREWFPNLTPAYPQPDPRVAYLLAAPAWLTDLVVVCVDLTLFDGRVFAASMPVLTDKHSLLNLAGLSGAAEVDLYIPGQAGALDFGVDVFLHHGMSIVFVPFNDPVGPAVSLRDMLQTHISWDERAAPDVNAYEDRFCLVADGFYRDFLLQPSRVVFYMHDIAVLFGLQTHRAAITPSRDRIYDAAIYGRSCRAVAAVGPTPDGVLGVAVVGILDCRPILEGWRKVSADQGWLDAAAVRHHYEQGAPPGFRVCLSGCMQHWRWLYIEPGQVVTVTFEPEWNDHEEAVMVRPITASATGSSAEPPATHDHQPPERSHASQDQGHRPPMDNDHAPADPCDALRSYPTSTWRPAGSVVHCERVLYSLPKPCPQGMLFFGPSLSAIVVCSCLGFYLSALSSAWSYLLGIVFLCCASRRPGFGPVCLLGGILLCQQASAMQLHQRSVWETDNWPKHAVMPFARPIVIMTISIYKDRNRIYFYLRFQYAY